MSSQLQLSSRAPRSLDLLWDYLRLKSKPGNSVAHLLNINLSVEWHSLRRMSGLLSLLLKNKASPEYVNTWGKLPDVCFSQIGYQAILLLHCIDYSVRLLSFYVTHSRCSGLKWIEVFQQTNKVTSLVYIINSV